MGINEITIDHIERLTDIQLTQLLHALLNIELEKHSIIGEAFVPYNITTGDGGDDGRVKWNSGPTKTTHLKNRFCLFQNKAATLTPKACYEEMLKPKKGNQKRELKPQIEELVKENGCYILFTNKLLNTQLKKDRIEKFRTAIKDTGFDNYDSILIEVYDANSIKDWVNENIGSITLVQKFNDITRPGFIIWEEWEKILEGSYIQYKKNETINQHIRSIHESIEKKHAVRIIGHSGLGKTRLALEVFRKNSENPQNNLLQNQVVYFELGINGSLQELSNYIISHQKQEGIFVVDSCDEDAHKAISGLINSLSKFRLITIDIASSTSEEVSFKMDRDEQRDIVKDIIDDILGLTHGQSDRDYLNNICEGYPWMAVKFCESIKKQGIDNFSGYLQPAFIKKLLFSGDNENDLEYDIIQACSIFSTFGFLDDELRDVLNRDQQETLEKQMEFIRTQIYDGQLVSESKFYAICQKYKSKDIIEQRGTQYIVKPTILAINLASEWLFKTPPSKIINILENLKGKSLSEKFVDRLKDLDQLDKAQQIVKDLWGPNSPFGSAEVLNSAWGSLLFRYVVEVNPLSTAKALKAVFGNSTKQELLNVKESRRNLIWALEKLCFRKETFPIASKILLAFGVSENETWGNNATNQFIHLFQLYLSGTEANLIDKLEVIKYAIDKKDHDYDKIIIAALGHALINHGYTRTGGAERQGSRVILKDYEPLWDEINEYWNSVIFLLTEFACSNNPNSEFAKEKLVHSYRSLLADGKTSLVLDSFRKVSKSNTIIWIDGINSLKTALSFEKDIKEKDTKEIQDLIDETKTNSIEEQLLLIVSKPEWTHLRKNRNEIIDDPKLNAEALAEKIVNENIEWENYLPQILKGEQRQAFNFGMKLGGIVPYKNEFIKKLFNAFFTIPLGEENIELIGGFIYGAQNIDLKNEAIDILFKKEEYNKYIFYLIRISKPIASDFDILFKIIEQSNLSITHFRQFEYGRALDNLNPEEVINLCDKIYLYNKEGQWTSLSLIFMYCFDNEYNWSKCKDFLITLISKENMLLDSSKINNLDAYPWSSSVEKILTHTENILFANTILSQIIEFCSGKHFNYIFDGYLKNIVNIVLEKYQESVWPIISTGLIGDALTFFHFKDMLKKLFENASMNEIILEWAKQNIDTAPKRLANMMPIKIKIADEMKWHPFAQSIIDEFGDQEEVLKQLGANMGTFGSSGSSVPYYKCQRTLLESLLNHPISNVRDWAESMIEYTERCIKREELDDEERSI